MKNTAKMYLVVALALGGIQCAVLFAYYHNHPNFSQAYFPPGPPDLPMVLEAPRLLDFYDRHHAEADNIFFDKEVEVRGTVTSVALAQDATVLTLATGNPASAIRCVLTDGLDIPKGTYITVKGRCLGYDRDVVLVHCLVKPADLPLH